MRPLPTAIFVLSLGASPALAQGTFNPGGTQPARRASPGLADAYKPPSAHRPPAAAAAPAAPAAGGFKPYEPYKGSSVYGAPKPASPGARACETSVYVNACPPKRP